MVYPFSLSKSKLVLLHAVLHEYAPMDPMKPNHSI